MAVWQRKVSIRGRSERHYGSAHTCTAVSHTECGAVTVDRNRALTLEQPFESVGAIALDESNLHHPVQKHTRNAIVAFRHFYEFEVATWEFFGDYSLAKFATSDGKLLVQVFEVLLNVRSASAFERAAPQSDRPPRAHTSLPATRLFPSPPPRCPRTPSRSVRRLSLSLSPSPSSPSSHDKATECFVRAETSGLVSFITGGFGGACLMRKCVWWWHVVGTDARLYACASCRRVPRRHGPPDGSDQGQHPDDGEAGARPAAHVHGRDRLRTQARREGRGASTLACEVAVLCAMQWTES